MLGGGERGLGRVGIAMMHFGGDVAGRFIPDQRRTVVNGGLHADGHRRRRILDLDRLERIACLIDGLRDHGATASLTNRNP